VIQINQILLHLKLNFEFNMEVLNLSI